MRTRRFCRSPLHCGPRWLSHLEFHVKVWGDETKTWPAQLQSECKCCQRRRARRRRASERGRSEPYKARGPRLPLEEKNRRRRIKYEKDMKDADRRKERRKADREYAATRRRQQGTPSRGPWTKYRDDTAPVKLNAEPLIRWLLEPIDLSRLPQNLRRCLRRAATSGLIKDCDVDKILVILGRPDIFNALYGDDDLHQPDLATNNPAGQKLP